MTLRPESLLNTLALCGLTLTARGELLDIEGDMDALTDDLVDVIREHKPALLQFLRRREESIRSHPCNLAAMWAITPHGRNGAEPKTRLDADDLCNGGLTVGEWQEMTRKGR